MQKSKNKKMRLVVDANAWISSLITPGFRTRLEVVFDEAYHLLTCERLFRELDRTVRRPKFANTINPTFYEQFVARLRTLAELVEVHSVVNVCRDSEDNYLLALAKDGNADYLITGDKDLRVMEKFGKTEIVTLSEFEAMASERN